MAVLGSAIGISYATANRSLLNARQAHENSSAAEIVQTQIEDLRDLSPLGTDDHASTSPAYSAPNNIYYPSSAFCIKDLTASPPIETNPANCQLPTSGATQQYQVLIYNCNNMASVPNSPCAGLSGPNNVDTFVIEAKWPDVQGQGTDSVSQTYRVHPPVTITGSLSGGGGSGANFGGCRGPGCSNIVPGLWNDPQDYLDLINLSDQGPNALTPQQQAEIIGCTWDWGYKGQQDIDTKCKPGDEIRHTYCTPLSACVAPDFPAVITVTLTEKLTTGVTPPHSEQFDIPTDYTTCEPGQAGCSYWSYTDPPVFTPCDPNTDKPAGCKLWTGAIPPP